MGTLVGAMGGTLGVNTTYTDAQKIEFLFEDVLNDSVVPLEVGNYLRAASVDAGNPILQQYVLGNGELFVITKTAKSRKFNVRYERKNGTEAEVEIPKLQGLVGGAVKVDASSQGASCVKFTGREPLVFGFQCFRIGVLDGEITVTSVQAGGVALAVGTETGDKPHMLNEQGLVDLRFPDQLVTAG